MSGCLECKYWESHLEYIYGDDPEDARDLSYIERGRMESIGRCHRFPPVKIPILPPAGTLEEEQADTLKWFPCNGDASDLFSFPFTRSWDWCGEFQPQTEDKAAWLRNFYMATRGGE